MTFQNAVELYLLNPVKENLADLALKLCNEMTTNEKIKISPKLIEKLEEFFKITNEGNVYMGCQFGIDRTNIALFMNYLMNPKVDNAPTILTWPYEKKKTVANKNIKVVKKIIKRMTPEQRMQLGIPEDYYSMLQTRIYDLLKKNNLL